MRGIFVGACVLASGCALAVSTSDYANGGAKSDGGTPPGNDAGTITLPDGAVVTDPEAGTPSDAGSRFCDTVSPKPVFCEDFDHGPLDLTRWDATEQGDQSSFTLDGTSTKSAPNAFLAGVKKGGDQYPSSWVRKDIGAGPKIRIACDVRVDVYDETNQGARLIGVQMGGGDSVAAGTVAMFGTYGNGMAQVNEEWHPSSGANKFVDHGEKSVAVGQWMHVIVRADATAKSLSVNVDGTEYSDGAPLQGPIADGAVSGIVGIYYPETDDKGWSVRYDNIVIDDQ